MNPIFDNQYDCAKMELHFHLAAFGNSHIASSVSWAATE